VDRFSGCRARILAGSLVPLKDLATMWLLRIGACLLVVTCLSGCGRRSDQPPLGTVKGVVTLDGEPLAEANVTFAPTEGGRTSTAVTNSDGSYELNYTTKDKGAKVGEHTVRVSTFQQGGDEPDSPKGVPEKVPKKYDTEPLVHDVSAGENVIDIELTTK
jgi:hypothetical protein